MADNLSNSAQAAVYAPDGTVRMVPNSDLQDALKNGGQLAVPMKSPKGDSVWVPTAHVAEAQQQGGKVDWSAVPDENHKGFWSGLGSTLGGFLKPGAQNPYPGMGQEEKTAAAQQSSDADLQRAREGRGMAYRALAPVAESVGADVQGMESAANRGDTSAVVGHAVGSAIPPVVGAAIGAGAEKVGPLAESIAKSKAEQMYRSALKPTTVPKAQVAVSRAINTGLENAVPVSEAGLEKLSTLIDDVNGKIKDTIASDPNRPVNKFKVANRLYDTADRFRNQVNPTGDLQAISDAGKEFIKTQPTDIPASEAQALKQGTYQQLKGKAYGELKGASVEAQKALARGLKEELASAFPELKDLNARDTQFYNLQPLLERAVARITNHQLIGIGTPAVGIAAKSVTGSGAAAGAAGFLKMIIDNPSVKSRLAIALSKSSNGRISPALANSRIAAYSAALANSSNGEPAADRTSE